MESIPKVSVCMITYNHEVYIKQAIEGILIQQTDFNYELVIGEDCSTDNTMRICEEYALLYKKIRLLPSLENLGVVQNFVRTLQSCKGKYIALCEGDDYWTDQHKLQKQVDFLEANPDFSICFHPVKIWKEEEQKMVDDYITRKVDRVTDIKELAKGNYIHTPSVLYRNNLFDKFPQELYKSPAGDYFLHMLNARFGKIVKLNEEMAVYRVHSMGAWSNVDFFVKRENWLKVLELLLLIDFNPDVKEILKTQHQNTLVNLIQKSFSCQKSANLSKYLQELMDNKYIEPKEDFYSYLYKKLSLKKRIKLFFGF